MNDLVACMNTSVSAASTTNDNRLISNIGECFFNHCLNRGAMLLLLETTEFGAIITDYGRKALNTFWQFTVCWYSAIRCIVPVRMGHEKPFLEPEYLGIKTSKVATELI